MWGKGKNVTLQQILARRNKERTDTEVALIIPSSTDGTSNEVKQLLKEESRRQRIAFLSRYFDLYWTARGFGPQDNRVREEASQEMAYFHGPRHMENDGLYLFLKTDVTEMSVYRQLPLSIHANHVRGSGLIFSLSGKSSAVQQYFAQLTRKRGWLGPETCAYGQFLVANFTC